jgi:hypothetical protein
MLGGHKRRTRKATVYCGIAVADRQGAVPAHPNFVHCRDDRSRTSEHGNARSSHIRGDRVPLDSHPRRAIDNLR